MYTQYQGFYSGTNRPPFLHWLYFSGNICITNAQAHTKSGFIRHLDFQREAISRRGDDIGFPA